MNAREKILAGAVGGLLGVFVIGFGIRAVIVKPLKEIDKKTAVAREKLDKIAAERRSFFDAEDRVKTFTERSFADTVDKASALSGEMLTQSILRSGLNESEFTRVPVGPRKLRGANEIGWSVQGDGALTNIVNLLFALENSPYLHRVEGYSVSAADQPGLVRARFRFLTLVIDPAPDVERKELAEKFTLDSLERRMFDGIVTRDLLRPYIKRPPPPAAAPAGAPGSPPPAAPGPETFKIVSLSEWQGQPEVHVLNGAAQKTTRYLPGDELAGGKIVCVDYRPMALPGSLGLLSHSRVILRIEGEYWAIERGKTLADKHKLDKAQLPTEIAQSNP